MTGRVCLCVVASTANEGQAWFAAVVDRVLLIQDVSGVLVLQLVY